MPAQTPRLSLQLRLRELIKERNRLNQQIRNLYQHVRKIDQEIAEVRLAMRRSRSALD